MPGHFRRCIVNVVLCSLFSTYLVAESESGDKKTIIRRGNEPKSQQEGAFRFFKKECSIVTSLIVRAYENGKFVGFLLIDRSRPPLGPALPGGIVRYKELPIDCAKRTLFDECGISSISNIQQFSVFSDPARDPRMHAVDITYMVRIDDQKINNGTDAKHAWICPLEKIPWDKLIFDHKSMLKTYLEHLIASKDNVDQTERILSGVTTKSSVRNKGDFEKMAKQAYRPPHLFVAGIIEIYQDNEFKGIAISDFRQENNVKSLPGGGVAYGETIEQAFQRHMKEKYQAETNILCQFKTYSFFNNANKKHDITAVFLAKMDEKALGRLRLCPLDTIPREILGFHHKDIVEDYLKYRKGEKVDICAVCLPSGTLRK